MHLTQCATPGGQRFRCRSFPSRGIGLIVEARFLSARHDLKCPPVTVKSRNSFPRRQSQPRNHRSRRQPRCIHHPHIGAQCHQPPQVSATQIDLPKATQSRQSQQCPRCGCQPFDRRRLDPKIGAGLPKQRRPRTGVRNMSWCGIGEKARDKRRQRGRQSTTVRSLPQMPDRRRKLT